MTLQQEILCEMWRLRLDRLLTEREVVNTVMSYVERVVSKELPVIIGINHMATLMRLDAKTLKSMVTSSDSFYHTFTIPKRRGGKRIIDAPYPSMRRAQRWIYEQILSKIDIHAAAMGFVRRRSICDNAAVHLGQECLLLLDIIAVR